MSSQRLALALNAGKLIVINRSEVEVSVTLVRFKDNPKNPRRPVHSKEIVTLAPKRERNLSRKYSVAELRASMKLPKGIGNCIQSRNVHVLDTWSK